jgi:hypothetical protein
MVDRANPRSDALDASRKEAEGERRRIEEEGRRLLRQLRGCCLECGGPIEPVVGVGFVMTTGCPVCQACYPRRLSDR